MGRDLCIRIADGAGFVELNTSCMYISRRNNSIQDGEYTAEQLMAMIRELIDYMKSTETEEDDREAICVYSYALMHVKDGIASISYG